MTYRKVVEDHYTDICNLSDLLNKLVNSYRLLVGGAGELNNIALAKKSDVKDAIHRANKLGDVIDEVIEGLDKSSFYYIDYCKVKSEVLCGKNNLVYIQTEIDSELFMQNDEK